MNPCTCLKIAPLFLAAAFCAGGAPGAGRVEVGNTEALKQALHKATPGTRIILAGGKYKGGLWAGKVRGAPGAPIVVAAKDDRNPPIFQGGRMGFEMAQSSYVVLDGLVVEAAEVNNIQFWNSHHIIVKNCISRNIKGKGNCDGIKLTAVSDFLLYNCTVANWGAEGSAVDMVGCARGLIMKCHFEYVQVKGHTANTIQPKCGSFNIGIYRCDFVDSAFRAIQFGGGIGPGRINRYDHFGKLKETGYSGVDQVAMGNVIVKGEAAVAYCSVANCAFEYNSIFAPRKYVMRILFEGGEKPTANNTFAHNLIMYAGLESVVNVGPKTKPETFRFAENYWFNVRDPAKSIPKLPAAETRPAGGKRPVLDTHVIFVQTKDSPAAAYGSHAPGLAKAWAKHTGKFKWAWEQAKRLEEKADNRPPRREKAK